MLRWGRIAAAYALLGFVSLLVAFWWRGEAPVVHPSPWLTLAPRAMHTYSLVLGVGLAAVVVLGTRHSVFRFRWARTLHASLRPFARGMSSPVIVALAFFSAFGEELVFRGLLQPTLGIWVQALAFGVVHQLPGPSRWVWVLWATIMGLALGAIFALTGSLLGPIVAHALVNGINLAFLRSHDPERRRALGGLLGEQPNP